MVLGGLSARFSKNVFKEPYNKYYKSDDLYFSVKPKRYVTPSREPGRGKTENPMVHGDLGAITEWSGQFTTNQKWMMTCTYQLLILFHYTTHGMPWDVYRDHEVLRIFNSNMNILKNINKQVCSESGPNMRVLELKLVYLFIFFFTKQE